MDKELAEYSFGTGENFQLHQFLGVHAESRDGQDGFIFRVWAPNAEMVYLMGDFSQWNQAKIPMTRRESGIWEVFSHLPHEGDIYKYLVRRKGGQEIDKIDPMAICFESRPGTGAIVKTLTEKKWKDSLWMGRRKRFGFEKRPKWETLPI